MPSLATSMEHVRLRRDGREQVIHGRVIVEAQDGGLLVLDQAHVLWTVMPDELIDRQQDAAPFESLDHKVLSSELLKQLPAGFKVHKTTHYLICYNTSQAYAKWCGSLLESLYKGFRNYWRKQQFELTDPDWPLVAIVFDSRQAYSAFAKSELQATGSITGYYSLTTNRVSMYDLTGADGRLFPQRNAQARIRQILSRPEAERTVATIVHEATHQLAFNCGLHTRFADIPLWVSEGLAIYFESPDLKNAAGWRSIGRINRVRNIEFREYLRFRAPDSLETLLATDERFRDSSSASKAYAEAWALNFFLIRTRMKEYRQYLQTLSKKKAMIYDEPEERLSLFRKAFGEDLRAFDTEFLRYVIRLNN
jgi:hypothetical protein